MQSISKAHRTPSAHFCSDAFPFNNKARTEQPEASSTAIYLLEFDATAESVIDVLGASAYKCLPEANALSLTHDLTKGFEKARRDFQQNITDDAYSNLCCLRSAADDVFDGLPYASKYDVNEVFCSNDRCYQIRLMEPEKFAKDSAKVAKRGKVHKFIQNVIDVPVKTGVGLIGIGVVGALVSKIVHVAAPNLPYHEPLVSSFVDAMFVGTPIAFVSNVLQSTNHLWHHFATKGAEKRLELNERNMSFQKKMFRQLTS